MKNKYYILVLDVGGTEIKGGIVESKGKVRKESIKKYPAKSNESKEVILSNFQMIISDLIGKVDFLNSKCLGICFAFPGPFDYENGISYIRDVNKYESIYGVNIYEYINNTIKSNKSLKKYFVDDFKVVFENDARVFAIGEYYGLEGKDYKKVVVITLGTGVGSAFIDSGIIVENDPNIPTGGYIYNLRFNNETIDEVLSARGIIKIAEILSKKFNVILENFEVKSLADKARKNEAFAKKVFEIYENNLIKILIPILLKFNADALILGGQISKSSDLFTNRLKKELSKHSIELVISKNGFISTFLGGYFIFKNRTKNIWDGVNEKF